ncbi:hypothetical protein [Ottowia sp.]|uniref:DUF7940 domain-containing protein n=1 Tax=Ottowia sp. TaxID=1898956 RepID=UPI003A88AEDC
MKEILKSFQHWLAEQWAALQKLELAPDWLNILKRAWSVRLMSAAFVLEALGMLLETVGAFTGDVVSLALRFVALCLVFAAFAARFAYQTGVSKEVGD